ncbi:lipopolysaccharide biosynthesis protein [Metabacillus halosaccharovorans]|uniref:lipopolysaccharide biosynthesis protein n=1 Tax=Metabacillus halosaccharovorans TaxID=930124 RepID=UPI000994DF27|nr:oligosaccharide flippase family protein [Metabacillus halosaccharovorans]
MRVKNSILNISAGIGSQIIITALSFVSRTVFINSLGIEYLGINGLLTNILAMLTLAEAGIGTSIMYSLYKPVAENNQLKINVLIKFYRKAYMIIALIVLLLGLALMPFLGYFIKDSSVEHIYLIYSIFLFNTVLPYLYVHKNSFLNVCQKGYIVTGIYSVSAIVTTILKIGILKYTGNYILYLIIDSTITIITTIILTTIVNKMYPFLRNKVTEKLDSETKSNITKNVKAIVLQNIGNYLVFGTDNILISSFVSVAAVGLYSNYNMLIEICRTFINQIFNNIYHSVGNLVANENVDKVYSVYKVYMLLNFWLYSIFTIVLLNTVEPFIKLWIGSEFIMSNGVTIVLMIIFYERGMRNSISTVKTTSGIFYEDRYAPLIQAAINLIISIVLVQYIGIVGVFIGTLISALAVPFWTTPYLVYKKVFHKSVLNYFIKYAYYVVIGVATYLLTSMASSFIVADNFLKLILIGFISFIVPNLIYVGIFLKTDEYKYMFGIVRILMGKFTNKSKLNQTSA